MAEFYLIDPDVSGAEIRVDIKTEDSEKISANVSVFDLIRNKQILNKRYTSSRKILRVLSHTISNDIFRMVTGREGVFKTKITYIMSSSDKRWLYKMDWDGKNPSRIVAKGLTLSHTWSPDGRWIAFVGRKDGKNQVFMIEFNGVGTRQLTGEGNNENPTFSPDGMFIAFDSDRDGSKKIYLMNIRSGRIKRITPENVDAMNPEWSPYMK